VSFRYWPAPRSPSVRTVIGLSRSCDRSVTAPQVHSRAIPAEDTKVTTIERKNASPLASVEDWAHLKGRVNKMIGSEKGNVVPSSESAVLRAKEGTRTIVAVVAASVISLVVWGLIVALNVR